MGYDDDTYGSSGYGADDAASGGYTADNADVYTPTSTSPTATEYASTEPTSDSLDAMPGGYGDQSFSPDTSVSAPTSRRSRGSHGAALGVCGLLAVVMCACILTLGGHDKAPAGARDGAARYVAVAIGCTGYKPTPLDGCALDAKNTALAFKGLGYETHLMNDDRQDADGSADDGLYPSKANIDQNLDAWLPQGGFGPQDTLVFCFSGHGMGGQTGDYLVPLEAQPGSDAAQLIDVNSVVDRLKATGAGRILLITDACRSYPNHRDTESNSFGAGLEKVFAQRKGPAGDNADPQMVCFRSCQKGEFSYCDQQGSFFTNALCNVLTASRGAMLTADMLHREVKDQVAALTTKQTPTWLVYGEEATEMVLTPGASSANRAVGEVAAAQRAGDLAALVAAAEPGQTVAVPAKVQLDLPLTIDKPLNLVGVGPDQTKVTCAGAGYVIKFEGDGPWTVKGICLQHTGKSAADVVRVEGGKFGAENCRFTGAKVGSGGTGDGSVTGGSGLIVVERGEAEIVGCQLEQNGFAGLVYAGDSRGVARKNRCSGNNSHGVAVKDHAAPTLDGNACANNGQTGIAYLDFAGGVARNNVLQHNGATQLAVGAHAHPSLKNNGDGQPTGQ